MRHSHIKRAVSAWIAAVFLLCTIYMYMDFSAVYADEVIRTGYITAGVTNVNIRSGPGTSYDRITQADGGLSLDIYEEVPSSGSYSWYYVGFYLNGVYTKGYVATDYVTLNAIVDYDQDADFESYLETQGFPESYRDDLRRLHAKYPKWIFVADYLHKDWNTVVENENVIGRSLIWNYAKSSWKSTAPGCYDWDTGEYVEWDSGGWVQASSELVQYALDPRNFLNSVNIFMFESLKYDAGTQDESGLSAILAGTFMENSDHELSYEGNDYTYSSALMYAGRVSGVSPYHLATRIIQEQGSNGRGSSISGTVSGYEGYYNYYNQGAYKTQAASAVENGLKYASRTNAKDLRPWDNRMKSIIGGAIYIGNGYINRGQDTIYYEKFDMVTPYTHQYMTNILAPRSESVNASSAYSEEQKANTPIIFTIPVYDNMPQTACPLPDADGSPNNRLRSMEVDGYTLTPTFSPSVTEYNLIVENETESIHVSGEAWDAQAELSGVGEHALQVGDNDIIVSVRAANGEIQNYALHVVRKAPAVDEPAGGFTTDYKLSDAGFLFGLGVSSSAETVLDHIHFSGGSYGEIVKADGAERKDAIATGDILVSYGSDHFVMSRHELVIYGDINGDSKIDLLDIIKIKRHLLELDNLTGAYYEAADANHDSQIDILDIVAVKKDMLGLSYIIQ